MQSNIEPVKYQTQTIGLTKYRKENVKLSKCKGQNEEVIEDRKPNITRSNLTNVKLIG